ncbi:MULTISPECIES: hypothetical protein [Haloarcula]|uniref:Uncharacterized protein n=1 Tax=Haloarcula pellucida TaxID=1427151 RepID=A0A830GSX3_9EURY|nr:MULTISPECIES: hypothetical protein [Halomicroarcula]MBX0349365.1 hypothetical protein [Halomicroarcula pellucida]MDS0279049.1 hypothetical protein [Halomicroarcula sp. S1AR25-4]QIO21423.1 hypothetical protein G9465_03255 [Haloarcula sp. JP-L23]GGO03290.1 hypothetical protein GCM10009030_38800 [Halomicroarcula pellucida]
MEPQATTVAADTPERDADSSPQVTAQETVPGQVVFTATDNTDGWIATDLTVDPADAR